MDIARFLSIRRKEEHGGHHHAEDPRAERGYLPFIANPINEDVRQVFSGSDSSLEKISTLGSGDPSNASTSVAGDGKTSKGNLIIYKQHHEASTIELFYDLFFVANLAYFTAMYEHTDAQALITYLKFFTLLWFTWLSSTLFDVRFGIDCVWNRLHKAVQFGVFTGFVFAGPVFDKYNSSGDVQSYKHFAIVLVVSRVAITMQYAVVMWQGRIFKQTLVPLALSTGVHGLAAAAYGITLAIFPKGAVGVEEQVVWFAISIFEGLAIFAIAMTWRILSFKYTHLVERLQLLTLIIIGEGIIGMVKSVACIVKGQADNNAMELGTVTASVLLLYLLWMLYFDQFSSDRFGTVRQQVWSILHYPFHMAILLCVEGNTSLIVWNSAVQALKWMWTVQPANFSDPAAGFNDTGAYLSSLNKTMYDIDSRFRSKYWNATYKWETNFTTIENYTATYGFRSDAWNNKTGDLVRYIFDTAQVFVFEAHKDSVAKLNAVTSPSASPRIKMDRISSVFNVTVMQFYIGSGAVLLILSLLYWFNKLHKTKYEFGEMINRVVVGFTLIIVGITAVVSNKSYTGFKYAASHWIIPIVVIFFATVLILDNLILVISHRSTKRASRARGSWGGETINDTSDDNDSTNLISKYPSKETPPNPNEATMPPSQVHTAYAPYDSAPAQEEGIMNHPGYPNPTAPRDRSRSPFSTSGGTLHGDQEERRFSIQDTPVDMTFAYGAIPDTREHKEESGSGTKRSSGGYESLGEVDEHEYEREEYEQHPMRVRTIKNGVSIPRPE